MQGIHCVPASVWKYLTLLYQILFAATVEPQNNVIGDRTLVLCREVIPISEVAGHTPQLYSYFEGCCL